MTTIAVDVISGEIVTDSRRSWSEGLIFEKLRYEDTAVKVCKIRKKLAVASTGNVGLIQHCLTRLHRHGNLPEVFEWHGDYENCSLILLTRKFGKVFCSVYDVERKYTWKDLLWRHTYTVKKRRIKKSSKTVFAGSGGKYAHERYYRDNTDLSHDLEFSVYVACQRDKYSGGEVKRYAV